MRNLAVAAVLLAGCHKGPKAPEWQVSGIGAIGDPGVVNLFDRSTGNSTQCDLTGVVAPPDNLPSLVNGYKDALSKLLDQKIVAFTVDATAPTITETKTTRVTRGADQCTVTLAGSSVGPALLAQGWGRAAPLADKALVDAEAAAKSKQLGMWSAAARTEVLTYFAKLQGLTAADLPMKSDLGVALKTADAWKDRLAYIDIDIETVMTVPDAGTAHWTTLSEKH